MSSPYKRCESRFLVTHLQKMGWVLNRHFWGWGGGGGGGGGVGVMRWDGAWVIACKKATETTQEYNNTESVTKLCHPEGKEGSALWNRPDIICTISLAYL